MSQFKRNPLNVNELMIWKRDKLVNPRTNRSIKENSKIYQHYNQNYNEFFPYNYDIFDSNDPRDPISLTKFYSKDESGNLNLEYDNPSNLILYKESESIIRCFEKETVSYMKAYNITKHPVSNKEIPKWVLDYTDVKELEKRYTTDEKALQVFQIFTNISIFIDYKLFLNLDKTRLIKLNYETKDFYYENLSIEDRIKIDNIDGKQYFALNESDLREMEIDEIKIYILEQIENIITYPEEDLKFMINYLILGGLSLVIPEVKKYYDDFSFSFQ